MSKGRLRYFRPRGMSTTKVANTGTVEDYQVVQNARGNRGVFERRRGMVRLAVFTTTALCGDFDGTNDFITLSTSTDVWPLGTVWTIETLFQTDDISSDRYPLGRSAAGAVALKVCHNTSSEVVATVTDSAGNTGVMTWTGVAAGTLCALRVTRSGAAVTGLLNGVSKTATMASATNACASGQPSIGKDNASGFFDGKVDFVRLFSVARTDAQTDGWCRLLNPRAPDVMMDMETAPSANAICTDRSRFGLHRSASGSLATGASIAVNPMPVQAIVANTRKKGTRELIVVAGGVIYPVTVS